MSLILSINTSLCVWKTEGRNILLFIYLFFHFLSENKPHFESFKTLEDKTEQAKCKASPTLRWDLAVGSEIAINKTWRLK